MATRQTTVPLSPIDRMLTFLRAFQAAADDEEMVIHPGKMEGGAPAIVIILKGKEHAFTTDEARRLAKIAEDAMNTCRDDPEAETLPNLIMGLRASADKAEALAEG